MLLDRKMVLITTASLTFFFAAAQSGLAQRGPGFVSQVDLATLENVQTELKLSEEQRSKVSEVSAKLSEDRQALFQGGGGDFAQNREKMTKLTSDATAKCRELLDDAQRQRLLEIFIQVNPASALAEQEVLTALGLTDDQKGKLAKVREAFAQATRDSMEQLRDLPREERREKSAKLRAEWTEKLVAELTAEQQGQFKAMAGEKIEIDLTALRRGRN